MGAGEANCIRKKSTNL